MGAGRIRSLIPKSMPPMGGVHPAALGGVGASLGLGALVMGAHRRRQQEEEERQWRRDMDVLEAKLTGAMMDKKARQEKVETQLASLARGAPEVYNRVAAGRRLPKEAVRIGGANRADLLEQLALRMADGAV